MTPKQQPNYEADIGTQKVNEETTTDKIFSNVGRQFWNSGISFFESASVVIVWRGFANRTHTPPLMIDDVGREMLNIGI
jgi:hypothetical protein